MSDPNPSDLITIQLNGGAHKIELTAEEVARIRALGNGDLALGLQKVVRISRLAQASMTAESFDAQTSYAAVAIDLEDAGRSSKH